MTLKWSQSRLLLLESPLFLHSTCVVFLLWGLYIIIIIIIIIIIFNLRTAAFKAYSAIWFRLYNFRHQASPRVTPRESTQRRKVDLWARNIRKVYLNADLHFTFRELLHAVKLRHRIDGFIYPPKEGVLRIFFALKIRRLRPGANPRTWVPKASMLPLDHRSHGVTLSGIWITRSYLREKGKNYLSQSEQEAE